MVSTRRLAAILTADVVWLFALHEGTQERVKAHLVELFDPKICEHQAQMR
jgi:hypothetical protein